MSKALHNRLAKTATRLIKKHGRTLELVSYTVTGPSYEPERTPVITPIIGVVLAYTASEVDGELIQVNDKRILVDSTVPITKDMKIRDNGVLYSLVNVKDLTPGSVTIRYRLQARAS